MLARFAVRHGVPVVYVANHEIPLPETTCHTLVICDASPDAADNYIVAHAAPGDIAVTRDIPLAARLVAQTVIALNDRGAVFTPETIGERLSERNFHVALAEVGIKPDKTTTYTRKNLTAFANTLEKIFAKSEKK
jgi:uncharacterized protein YaiI (UPF0178 family)